MQATAVVFSELNKRMACILDFIKSKCPESARTRLQQHCQTRWVEKQSSVLTFRELYPAVLAALASLSTCPRSGGKALMLSNDITDSSFLVAVEVMAYVMQVTKSLSILLQLTTIALQVAISSVEYCVSALERMRAEDEWFEIIFSKAEVLYVADAR